MVKEYLLAGFGGQGILFAGKFLAYAGLTQGKQVSWIPSYGPEMRGGTANCSVVISDDPVGSPIVAAPDIFVAMNLPSLDKFENAVKAGGTIFVDSSLISRKIGRKDVKAVYLPASRIAQDSGFPKLANMVMTGRVLKDLDEGTARAALLRCISGKHTDMIEINMKALLTGKAYN